jgi:hypothetical protein
VESHVAPSRLRGRQENNWNGASRALERPRIVNAYISCWCNVHTISLLKIPFVQVDLIRHVHIETSNFDVTTLASNHRRLDSGLVRVDITSLCDWEHFEQWPKQGQSLKRM